MKISVLTQLVHDLRDPPKGFPKFNFDYNFFIDEDGKTYGDVTAYVACRALGHPNKIPQFLIDGGDLYYLFKQTTRMSVEEAAQLVYPHDMISDPSILDRISGDDMADIVADFIEYGGKLNLRAYPFKMKYAECAADNNARKYEVDNIEERVHGFVDRYGYKA